MAKEIPITEFDMLTLNESTQMFKAIIPFLDFNVQKSLSLLVRFQELQQTMSFYQNPRNRYSFSKCNNDEEVASCSSINDLLGNEKFLKTVLVYCPENYASMIQNFIQFSKMSDIFRMFNDMNPDGNGAGTSDPNSMLNLASMLGGDYSSMMKNATDMMSLFNMASSTSGAAPTMNQSANQDTTQNSNQSSAQGSNQTTNSSNTSSAKAASFHDSKQSARPNTDSASKNPSPNADFMKNFMNPEQQKMYDDFLHQLDAIDLGLPPEDTK